MAITFGRPMGIFYSYKEMNIMEKINNKITEFIRSQIEIGATLIFENPAEQYGATSISNVLIRCSDIRASLLKLYGLLKSYAYGDKIHCFPGQETLGYWMGKNRSTINRYLAELRKIGLIDWIQVGLNKPNVYIIKNIPKEYTDKYAIKKKELEGKHSKKQDQNVVKLPNTEISDVTKPSHPVNTLDVTKPSHPVNTLDVTKPSHPDVTKPSHKENKINNNVVVVMKTPSKIQEENPVNGNAFDDPSNKIQYTINKIERVTGIKISKSYAQEITSKYTMEKIDIALDDMEQQLKNGMVFKVGVGSWLQAYLIRGYVPDQIPENQKSPHKTRTSYTSINKVRNNHKTSSNYLTQQKLKKKEFIKTLYT